MLQFTFLLPGLSNLALFAGCTSGQSGERLGLHEYIHHDFDTAKPARNFLCNFLINVRRNVEKCFCCSCKIEVLHRAKQPEQPICAERAWGNQRLARPGQRSVGFTKKDACARDKMRSVLKGCYTVQQRLQIVASDAKSRTEILLRATLRATTKYALQVVKVPCCNSCGEIPRCNRALNHF